MTVSNTEKLYTEWLVLRCQDHDKNAFVDLYEVWNSRFHIHVLKISDSTDQTPDILQNGWIAISKNLHKIKDPRLFPAWGYRIMTNKVRDWQRKQIPYDKRHSQISDDELKNVCAEEDAGETDDELIKMAIDKLNDQQKELIKLYYYREMKIGEIASAMNIARGTVKSRLFTARQKLKEIIERIDDGRKRK